MRVVVRVRPLNDSERAKACSSVIDVDRSDSQVSIFSSRSVPPKTFAFDAVYDPSSHQQQIYDETAFPLVESVLEGYNGTIFAYGQTGCGKTFTMSGDEEHPGVIPNAFRHIFGAISDTQTTRMFLVYCSYVEIYNEEIRDLLVYDPAHKLELKENADSGVYIKGVSKQPVSTVHDINRLMDAGASHRITEKTAMNNHSSRSHSIFTVYVEMSEEVEGRQAIRAGKLNLVDLAGSERQKKTQATGDRLKEAIEINLSLSALGNVISALVDGHSSHIPYRDSKLTRLLQDSLGGNTKTIMIAVASPADYNYDESLSTLRYASRAKSIQNKPKINEDPKDALLRQYLEQINELKKQLATQGHGEKKVVIVEVPVYVKVPRKRQGMTLVQQDLGEEGGRRGRKEEDLGEYQEEAESPYPNPRPASSDCEELDTRQVDKKPSKRQPKSQKPTTIPEEAKALPTGKKALPDRPGKAESGSKSALHPEKKSKAAKDSADLQEYKSVSPSRKRTEEGEIEPAGRAKQRKGKVSQQGNGLEGGLEGRDKPANRGKRQEATGEFPGAPLGLESDSDHSDVYANDFEAEQSTGGLKGPQRAAGGRSKGKRSEVAVPESPSARGKEEFEPEDEYANDFEAEESKAARSKGPAQAVVSENPKKAKQRQASKALPPPSKGTVSAAVESDHSDAYGSDFEAEPQAKVSPVTGKFAKSKQPNAAIRTAESDHFEPSAGHFAAESGSQKAVIQLKGKQPKGKVQQEETLIPSKSLSKLAKGQESQSQGRERSPVEEQESVAYPDDFEDKDALIAFIGKQVLQGGQAQGKELADLKKYHEDQVKRQKAVQSLPKPTQPPSLISSRYNSLSEEVTSQRTMVKSLQTKYKSALTEIQDLNHEHEMAKEDLLAGIRSKDHEMTFLHKVLEQLLTPEQISSITERARFEEDEGEWQVPDFVLEKNNPLSFPKLQRRGEDLGEVKGRVVKLTGEEDLLRNAKFQDWKKGEEKKEEKREEGGRGGGGLKAVILDPLEQMPVPVLDNDPPHSRKRLLKPLAEERKRSYIS